ncbi:hypothetical protein K458DRAFT_392688 [Lentithecium fluviatile CBS 122367]|uniref:Uncharacterized protein n=1 Tax=Lentithecium fluviatile CBS 122367 TaxID=1168545 RepID=A0A6G1IQW9_9PLEO|nr:hypothetical protein K458DRAFT_392688 [Lentithecium fluviatile CBS 122367]
MNQTQNNGHGDTPSQGQAPPAPAGEIPQTQGTGISPSPIPDVLPIQFLDNMVRNNREFIYNAIRQMFEEEDPLDENFYKTLETYNQQALGGTGSSHLAFPKATIDTISQNIDAINEMLDDSEETQRKKRNNDADYDPTNPRVSKEDFDKLLTHTINLLNCFSTNGMEWMYTVPNESHEAILGVLTDESNFDHRRPNLQQLIVTVLRPSIGQSQYLTSVSTTLTNLFNERKISRAAADQMYRNDVALREWNIKNKFPETDHSFPWHHLTNCVRSQTDVTEGILSYYLALLQVPNCNTESKLDPSIIRALEREALSLGLESPQERERIQKESIALLIDTVVEKADTKESGHAQGPADSSVNAETNDVNMDGHQPGVNMHPRRDSPNTRSTTAFEGTGEGFGAIGGEDSEMLVQVNDRHLYPAGIPITTVAWGRHAGGRIFYINKIGFPGGTTYRRDTDYFGDNSGRWEKKSLQPRDCITWDRFGDRRSESGDKKYTKRHLVGIFGIVLDIMKYGTAEEALAALDPDNRDNSKRWDATPVLTGWKPNPFDSRDGQVIRRWETRGCFRERTTKISADRLIFQAAKAQENNFAEGIRRSRSPSAGLIPGHVEALRAQSLGAFDAGDQYLRQSSASRTNRGAAFGNIMPSVEVSPPPTAARTPRYTASLSPPPLSYGGSSVSPSPSPSAPDDVSRMVIEQFLKKHNCSKQSELPATEKSKLATVLVNLM